MWIEDTSHEERKTLTAAFAGYATDAFDYMIYTMLIPTLIAVWGMTRAQAGFIATGSLITSAIGGWAAGVLADKYGRVRMLQLTVLWFSVFTFLSGFTNSYEQLLITRALQGLGLRGRMVSGLRAGRRDDPGASSREGRGPRAECLGSRLGNGGDRVLGRVCPGSARTGVADPVLDRRASGSLDPLYPSQPQGS